MAAGWSPTQYLRFADERTRAARDLLAALPAEAPVRAAVDIGCGPGNSTELIAARYPDAKVAGIDSSEAMLEAARARLPGLRFERADVAAWSPQGSPDLLFANAVFQWVPDHPAVLARLLAELAPGGMLAVQMPDNMAEPSHVLMRETAADGPWREALAPVVAARGALPPVEAYYDLLAPLGAVDAWHTAYNHVLADAPAILDWVRSTGLRPFLEALDEKERRAFEAAYLRRLRAAYPPRVDGKVLLRFPRLFIVAVRR